MLALLYYIIVTNPLTFLYKKEVITSLSFIAPTFIHLTLKTVSKMAQYL